MTANVNVSSAEDSSRHVAPPGGAAADGDAARIARLAAGDRAALAELFDPHRARLYRMVAFRLDRRLRARVDPEDVLQEAYLDAERRVEHYLRDTSRSLFVWFRLIVAQTLIDVHRRHLAADKRDAGRDRSLAGTPSPSTSACLADELLGDGSTPSQAAIRGERTRQLEAALAAMSDIDQEIIALRHFEDLSNAEVAEALELSPTAASNRYVRALARLKEILSSFPDFAATPPG